jgi:hypothetical protein
MTKLPEPEGRICFDGGDWEEDFVSSQDAYSREQMLQFRRDALEEAAQWIKSYDGYTDSLREEAIRKLKETT